MVGRLLSYWEGNFSGAMLNFGRVHMENKHIFLANTIKIRWIFQQAIFVYRR